LDKIEAQIVDYFMLSLSFGAQTNTSRYFRKYLQDLFPKTRKLVKLEIEAIDRICSNWQAILASSDTDRHHAEQSIKSCYKQAGLDTPSIIWAEHPLNVIKILFNRPDLYDVSDVFVSEFWQCELAIQKAIATESATQVLNRIDPKYQVKMAPGGRKIEFSADYLNELVMSQVEQIYCELTDCNLPKPFQDYNIGILGYFDYFSQIGIEIPQIQPTIELAKSCGWCWTFEKLAILTPKHSGVKVDRSGKIMGILYNDINILK
jgi:hypothetical protein